MSYITPNNCSDGHDAVCHGNNLSGGFTGATPNPPINYTGGLYAADLFLEHEIPIIERSPAYKDGGLIDITFDEAFPPFTYTGNSFANASTDPAIEDKPSAQPTVAGSLAADSAGETLFGEGVGYEPTGPNVPLSRNAAGDELYPGPGDNSYIDRPGDCVSQTVPSLPAGTCLLGGGSTPAADFPQRTDLLATAPAGSNVITDSPSIASPAASSTSSSGTTTTSSTSSTTAAVADNGIQADDQGRAVTGNGIPPGSFVGPVTAVPQTATAANGTPGTGAEAYTASFQLVDTNGDPVTTTGPVSGITLAADTAQNDPLFTATGATTGGGDTGSVLISPYIKPGTSSNDYYNHYSWLRTMEDLFGVASQSPGLDGLGHIGYAAQPGLAPFGSGRVQQSLGQGRVRASARRTSRRDGARARIAARRRFVGAPVMSPAATWAPHTSRVIRPGSRRVVGVVAGGLLAAGLVTGCGGSGRAGSPTRSSTTGMVTTPPAPKVSARVKAQERAIHHVRCSSR